MTDYDRDVKELVERAEVAKEIAGKIKILQTAHAHSLGVVVHFNHNGKIAVEDRLAEEVFKVGCQTTIDKLERELRGLLGIVLPGDMVVAGNQAGKAIPAAPGWGDIALACPAGGDGV